MWLPPFTSKDSYGPSLGSEGRGYLDKFSPSVARIQLKIPNMRFFKKILSQPGPKFSSIG